MRRHAIGGSLLRIRPDPRRRPGRAALKRAFDVGIAGVLLLVLAPLLILIAAAVVLESGRPVLFRAPRVGRDGVPIEVLKFRKMAVGAAGPRLTADGDGRLTRVGSLLRRTHLDEAPQLWNVLRGQMSLVGPRPEDARFVAAAPGAYAEILRVAPGLTGWTQLVYVDEARWLVGPDPERVYVRELLPRKAAIDLLYVQHRRIASDLKVLLWTVLVASRHFAVRLEPGPVLRLVRPGAATQPVAPASLETVAS